METARVVLDFVKALVWPAVVTVLAFLFREGLGDVLRRLTELSGFGMSAKLAEQVRRQKDKADDLPPVPTDVDAGGPNEVPSSDAEEAISVPSDQRNLDKRFVAKHLEMMALRDPAGAIRASWLFLRHEVKQVAQRLNVTAQSPSGVLREIGASDQVVDLYRGQERIYYEVKDARARRENVSRDTAEAYLSVTETLMAQLAALENVQVHAGSRGEAKARSQPNGSSVG